METQTKQQIIQTLKEILQAGSLDYEDISFVEIEGTPSDIVNIKSKSLRYNEELTKSLAHLTRVISGVTDRFFVDINEVFYRKIQKLHKASIILAQRAISLKTDVELKPMPPRERYIIHNLLQDFDESIKTQSEGEGRKRHIVIKYIGD